MERPANYERLPDGVRCRCINLWRDADGSYWCCKREGGETIEPVGGGIFFDGKVKSPRELAEDDVRLFGNGFTRKHPDGRIEHIPPDQVTIHGNAIHVKK